MFLRCLSGCALNLSTEQEDTKRTYLGNLLNIIMERHLKLLNDGVSNRPIFTCETTQDRPPRSEYVQVIGTEKLGTNSLIIFHKYPLPCINNSTLSKTQHSKYLGVLLDHTVLWIQHITYVNNKIAKGMGIMYKGRRYLSKKSLVNLYHLYIDPYLIYGIESWGNAAHCHLDPLFKLYKKIIIIITFSNHNAHTGLIFNRLNILPLYKLI